MYVACFGSCLGVRSGREWWQTSTEFRNLVPHRTLSLMFHLLNYFGINRYPEAHHEIVSWVSGHMLSAYLGNLFLSSLECRCCSPSAAGPLSSLRNTQSGATSLNLFQPRYMRTLKESAWSKLAAVFVLRVPAFAWLKFCRWEPVLNFTWVTDHLNWEFRQQVPRWSSQS